MLSAVWEQTRHAHLPVPLVDRELQSVRRSGKGEFWAFLSLMPQLGSTCRTAKDIMGGEAYGRRDGRERSNDDSPCSTLA